MVNFLLLLLRCPEKNGDAIQGDVLSRMDSIASVSLITSRNEAGCGSPASLGRNR